MEDLLGPRKNIVDGCPDPPQEGELEGEMYPTPVLAMDDSSRRVCQMQPTARTGGVTLLRCGLSVPPL